MMEQSAKYSVQGITSAFVGELQDDLDTLKDVKTGKVQLLCDDVDYPCSPCRRCDVCSCTCECHLCTCGKSCIS